MSVLTYLLDLLERIPGTFWGVIIGAFFTLSGIILTNRAHDRRLQTQLAHDRDLKNREREMSLRKDIYLTAAETVSAGLIAIGRFPNLEVPHEKLTEGYLDKAPSIAKVHVIANEATAKAVINFSGELSATFLRLFARRFPLVEQKQKLDLLRAQMDTVSKENTRTLELIKQYNIDGLHDPHKWDVLQHNFEFEQRSFQLAMQEVDALTAELIPKQIQYAEECFGETVKLGRLLMPMIFSIRKELELPIDETEFCRITEAATTKQVESFKEFMQQLPAVIVAQSTDTNAPPPIPGS